VRIGSPAAVLAVVPHLLGFVPRNSLVVLGAGPPRGRIRLTLRFNLPDPPDPAAARAIAEHTVSILTRERHVMAIVIGYGPGHLVTPVADVLRDRASQAGVGLKDVLRVEDGRYWSYLCHEPSCCPPQGVPVAVDHPAAAAVAAAGGSVLPDRAALTDSVSALGGTARQSMRQATHRAELHLVSLLDQANRSGQPGKVRRLFVLDGLSAVADAIATYRRGGRFSTDDQVAWLSMALTSFQVRDDAWARMDMEHRDAHRRLWTDVLRRAEPAYVPAPASLLAFTAWQCGNGALANVALDRALEADPKYSMALLLRDIIDAATPPSMAQLPLTPEQVAASYAAIEEEVEQDQTGRAGDPGNPDGEPEDPDDDPADDDLSNDDVADDDLADEEDDPPYVPDDDVVGDEPPNG
jgi:hypothetical protein